MAHAGSIEVRTIPSNDAGFRDDVHAALDVSLTTLGANAGSIVESRSIVRVTTSLLDAVREHLSERYPNVVVHLRDRLAAVAETEPDVVYAYRDGDGAA